MARGKKGDLEHDTRNEPLTDDEIKALTFMHVKRYRDALAAKKSAAAAFLSATKLAKSELGDTAIADIKQIIAAEDDEDYEAKLQAEVERKARVARWLGLKIGTQEDMFSSSASLPVAEKAYEDGKTAGLKGEVLAPPHGSGTEAYGEYVRGWHDGQAALTSLIKKKETPNLIKGDDGEESDTDVFDDAAEGSDLMDSGTSEPLGEGEVGASVPGDTEVGPPQWPDDGDISAREDAEEI